MNRELIGKAIALLVSYRKYTLDCRIANVCGEIVHALKAELAKPEQALSYEEVHFRINTWKERNQVKPQPIISFTDGEEGLWVHMGCNGAHFSENLSESKAAAFFINAYRDKK